MHTRANTHARTITDTHTYTHTHADTHAHTRFGGVVKGRSAKRLLISVTIRFNSGQNSFIKRLFHYFLNTEK